MSERPLFWVVFNAVVLALLLADLGLWQRSPRVLTKWRAVAWVLFWVALAAGFGFWIARDLGHQKAMEFATGYAVEQSLSVDNLFVFLLIFNYLQVPAEFQHKVLFWGILGALAARGLFIWAGVELLRNFEWIAYVLGGLLIASGVVFAVRRGRHPHPEKNPALRLLRRLFRVTSDYDNGKFVTSRQGLRWATPLVIALVMIETTDIVFALDSIPAVLAITRDAFIVYTSNVFAVLGLRALYFALAGLMQSFRFVHYGLAAILIFTGCKMLTASWFVISPAISLAIIVGILAATGVLSAMATKAWPPATSNRP